MGRLLHVGVSIVDMLRQSSMGALVSISFLSNEALGIGTSFVQLGNISVKPSVV